MPGKWIVSDHDPVVRRALDVFSDGDYEEAYAIVARHRGRPADNIAAAALLLLGHRVRAHRRLRRMDPEEDVNYAIYAALLWVRRRRRAALALVADLPPEHVAGLGAYTLTTVVHRSGGGVPEVFRDTRHLQVVNGVAAALYVAGAFADSARWLEERGTRPDHPYYAACAWARAGDVERAFAALRRAASLGFSDGVGADLEDDLAPLRAHPEWAAVRARLGGPTAAG